jgi:2-polyprenyl-6-methoxyphenol hydroxylase-like FAD-dependent oxidoreductase
MQSDDRSHAIVIGGSMAGLLAARVLVNHFDRVTMIDRDSFPDGPRERKGVPQARHAHVLLMSGNTILERLFPGINQQLLKLGAEPIDWTADCRYYLFGGWRPRGPSKIRTNVASRDLLEFTVRERLEEQPNIEFVQECDVVGLIADEARTAAMGVRLRHRGKNQNGEVKPAELRADLVVDASGRDSKAPAWLAELGYPEPKQTTINSFLGYASRFYERPKNFKEDWKLLVVGAVPPEGKRSALILPIEGNRWLVTLAGAGRDYPPTDEEDFLEYSRSLPDIHIYEALAAARPLSPVAGYRRTENRVRHYETLPRWLERFLVLGDAACSFNPVYGQGMTVGSMGADLLDQMLQERSGRGRKIDLARLSESFQKRLAKVWAGPWVMATGADMRYTETVGGKPGPLARVFQKYIDQVLVTGSKEPTAHVAFLEVMHFVSPPQRLLYPDVLALVARRWIIKRLSGPPAKRAAPNEANA